MKRFLLLFLVSGVVALSALRLAERHREETADRSVALIVDWQELRDEASRTTLEDAALLSELRKRHVTGLLVGGMTLQDLSARGRITGADSALTDPLWSRRIRVRDLALAPALYADLRQHGVSDLAREGTTLSRAGANFIPLKDIELRLDPALHALAQEYGLQTVYRLNRDPWVSQDAVRKWFDSSLGLLPHDAVLFNSDDPPGGEELVPFWAAWVQRQSLQMPLFEFKPSKMALRLALAVPSVTSRAHTIPTPELRDLNADQEQARWRRAVAERSCRFLLVHAGPSDSLEDHLERLDRLSASLDRDGWRLGWPLGHPLWRTPGQVARLAGIIALLVAILVPAAALALAWPMAQRASLSLATRLSAFLLMSAVTIAGGTVVAALTQNPATQLEITPFRGIKLAFVLSWFGAIFILYSWRELTTLLEGNVRRMDLLLGLLLVGLIGYAVIRSGNASAGWKHPMEQHLRDRLELSLIARPRFKEFAVGHPLALLGFLLASTAAGKRRRSWAAKPLVAIGMMGQASIINSFCHLHSPIRMAFARSVTGLAAGVVIGLLLYAASRMAAPQQEL